LALPFFISIIEDADLLCNEEEEAGDEEGERTSRPTK
jgi:hypothetical protein